MKASDIIVLIIVIALLAYLLWALIAPEDLQ